MTAGSGALEIFVPFGGHTYFLLPSLPLPAPPRGRGGLDAEKRTVRSWTGDAGRARAGAQPGGVLPTGLCE